MMNHDAIRHSKKLTTPTSQASCAFVDKTVRLKWELTLHLSTTQMGGVIPWPHQVHVMLLGRQCLYGIMGVVNLQTCVFWGSKVMCKLLR